ncbi:hypothetical protein [Achromobacter ruhlandii]|uniref:hypothetical protein n=1 Tax=Achromobacter ruhlandii TaxID=72557 RepID=UPI003BA030B6
MADVQEFIDLRRDLHRHPELSFVEHRTSDIVASCLARLGYTVEQGMGGTGVGGHAAKPEQTIAPTVPVATDPSAAARGKRLDSRISLTASARRQAGDRAERRWADVARRLSRASGRRRLQHFAIAAV